MALDAVLNANLDDHLAGRVKITRVTAEAVIDGGSVAAVMAPRRGLVLEAVEEQAADGCSASFRQAEGPLASYRPTRRGRRPRDRAIPGPPSSRPEGGPAVVVMAARTAVALLAGARPARGAEAWPGQRGAVPLVGAAPQRLDRRQAMVMATLAALGECAGVFGRATARNAHLCGE